MANSDNRYSKRGVSAQKEDVHNAIRNLDKGLFPSAFCKIIPDILGGDENYCNIMHADGAEQNRRWHICTGAKPAICRFGKALHRMP